MRDAIVFLRQGRKELFAKMARGQIERIPREGLFMLLALDALTGGAT